MQSHRVLPAISLIIDTLIMLTQI